MKPDRLRDLLDNWFDGTLDRVGHLELEEAARQDAEVSRVVRRQERLVRALGALDDPRRDAFDVERFVDAVEARVDRGPVLRARARPAPWLLVAAALAAALVGLWYLGPWLATDEPIELPGPRPDAPIADAPVESGSANAPELVANTTDVGRGWMGPAFEVAAVAPAADRERFATAIEATRDVLRRVELPRGQSANEARSWRDRVRREIEQAVGMGWTVNALVERRANESESADEVARAAAFLLIGDEAAGRRRALRVLDDEGAAPIDESGVLAPSAVRAAWRRAVLAAGSNELVVELVAAGDFDASDAPAVVERFLADASLAPRLLRRALDSVDVGLLTALVCSNEALVEPLIELALEGRRANRVVAALRDVPLARSAAAERLVAARSNGERRRALELVGEIGAVEALADVQRACLEGEPVAFEALRLLPGHAALEAWVELAPALAPGRRTAAWYAVVDRRGHELAAYVSNSYIGNERLPGLADALIATGSTKACEALLELAARPELHVLERATCVDAALALGAARVLSSDAALAVLTRVASGAPDDVRVQEACLVLVQTVAGHERAVAWCIERFGDDGPCDVLGEDFDAGAPRAMAVRARLRLFLDKTLKTRFGA